MLLCPRKRNGLVHALLAAEATGIGVEPGDQHCEIVVVAERLGEIVEPRDQRRQDAGRSGFEQPDLVPQRLDRLAPLVHPIVGCPALRTCEVPSTAPVRLRQSVDQPFRAAVDVPMVDPGSGSAEKFDGPSDLRIVAVDRAGRLGHQFGLSGTDGVETGVGVNAARCAEIVQGCKRGVGVADRGQFVCRIAHEGIERPELGSDRRAHQAGQRTRLLTAFPHGVDGVLRIGRLRSIE